MSGQGRGLAALAGVLTEQLTASEAEDRPVATPDTIVEAPVVTPTVQPRSTDAEGRNETPEATSSHLRAATPQPPARPTVASRAPRSTPAPALEKPAEDTQDTQDTQGPRYLRFEPKTVRLTAEQVDALQAVETRLRRAARGKRRQGDELPSWNMLARIGVDLVLREADRLAGLTENELRASVGLDPLTL